MSIDMLESIQTVGKYFASKDTIENSKVLKKILTYKNWKNGEPERRHDVRYEIKLSTTSKEVFFRFKWNFLAHGNSNTSLTKLSISNVTHDDSAYGSSGQWRFCRLTPPSFCVRREKEETQVVLLSDFPKFSHHAIIVKWDFNCIF